MKRNIKGLALSTFDKLSVNLSKGFTLVELLVVISIVAILSAMAMVGVSGAQKQGRDTQRRSDLNQYRVALESYAASNNTKYPGYAAGYPVSLATMATGTGLIVNYMNGKLIDPKNSATDTCPPTATTYGYCYRGDGVTAGATSTKYWIIASLETGDFWEVCSNGRGGKVTAVPTDAECTVPVP